MHSLLQSPSNFITHLHASCQKGLIIVSDHVVVLIPLAFVLVSGSGDDVVSDDFARATLNFRKRNKPAYNDEVILIS